MAEVGRRQRFSPGEFARRRRDRQEAWRRAHGVGVVPRPRGAAATAEVEYSDEEREFLTAVDRWKAETGTRFPTLTQLLGVLRGLGYRKPGTSLLREGGG